MLMQPVQTQKVVTRVNVNLDIKEMEKDVKISMNAPQITEGVMLMQPVKTQKVVICANVNLDIEVLERSVKISTNAPQTTEDVMLMQPVKTQKVVTRANVNLDIKEMESNVKHKLVNFIVWTVRAHYLNQRKTASTATPGTRP